MFIIISIVSCVLFSITLYHLIISFFCWQDDRLTSKAISQPQMLEENKKNKRSFALVIAAHNEEAVISSIIQSLKKVDYDKSLYHIFVIADNCTDQTAEIARENGAMVYERTEPNKKGKGFALEWMFKILFAMDIKYDAVAVFDADNLVSRSFLKEMNNVMNEGYKVVQGYIDSKNPGDSWITACYSISFWSCNRIFQMARKRLGLTNQIGGTGFCMDMKILKTLGWEPNCLTEDLEFTCKLVLNNEKVGWAHYAIVYDEKPLTLSQSWRQRKRWMQGFADVNRRYFIHLIRKGIKERKLIALDCALYTLQPYITIGIGIPMLYFVVCYADDFMRHILSFSILLIIKEFIALVFPKLSFHGSDFLMYILFWIQLLYIPAALFKDKKLSLKIGLWYIVYPIFIFTWVPITIDAILSKRKREWNPTKHTRGITIEEIEELGPSNNIA